MAHGLPLPGEQLDGGIVIASVYTGSDDDQGLVLLLVPDPGRYYRVIELRLDTMGVLWRMAFPNIVPAVDIYQENGGDY